MSFLYSILDAVVFLLHQVIQLYVWIIIASAVISWIGADPYNQIVQFIHRLTEPSYAFVKKFIPTNISGFDISPIIVILALTTFDRFITTLLL